MSDNVYGKDNPYLAGDIKIDGVEPSPEFLEYAEKERRDEITPDDILKINGNYKAIEDTRTS
jgi:hypothetical protein